MRLLFVADPLEQFNIKKDSTFAMMKEAAARGHEILACEPRHLVWQRGGRVGATMRQVALSGDPVYWFTEQHVPQTPLADVDAVLMRKDPPFDIEYVTATWLLEQAEREGARVFNRPAALRDHAEKIALAEFARFVAGYDHPDPALRFMHDLDLLVPGAALEACGDELARHGWLPLYLALPLGVALLWLPWLLPGNRTAVATVGEPDIARLARDLSHNTSQNALSAAGVAFSVKRLAEKLQSQLDAAEQIVGSAEVMIHTERATSNLARQAMDAATRARAGGCNSWFGRCA